MPRFDDPNMEVLPVKATNFSFSAVRMDKLGATEYTLVSIVLDKSGSVGIFKADLERCVAEVVKACKFSPRADNLMLRLTAFNGREEEIHGFKLIQDCNPDDYIGMLSTGGNTALFDASYKSIEAMTEYGKALTGSDFSVNAIVFVITDGEDNESTFTPANVKQAIEDGVSGEKVESLVSVLIGVDGNPRVKTYLENFSRDANFTQYVSMGDANEHKLAKLAEWVSKSISSQSTSLGSGGGSKPIDFTF